MPLRLKRNLMRVGAKIIIALLMTVAGGILVGAILLRSLLFYPETLQPLEPHETIVHLGPGETCHLVAAAAERSRERPSEVSGSAFDQDALCRALSKRRFG